EAKTIGAPDCLTDLQRIQGSSALLLRMLDEILEKEGASALRSPQAEPTAAGEVAAIPAVALAAPTPAAPEARQGFILVADDVEMNRDVLTRRLEREGYTVAAAENGRQALEMTRARRFDLLLLDMMMPEMSGLEV